MPETTTIRKAREDAREGKSPSTQAGEFVREEIDHIRERKHGARSTKQAIAIGLSKARRAGVKLPDQTGRASSKTRTKMSGTKSAPPSRTRSRGALKALKREPHTAASPAALSRHAKESARTRGAADLRQAARKAARTRARNK